MGMGVQATELASVWLWQYDLQCCLNLVRLAAVRILSLAAGKLEEKSIIAQKAIRMFTTYIC